MEKKKDRSYLLVLLIGIFFALWIFKIGVPNEENLMVELSRIKSLSESISIGNIRALIHNGLYGYGYAYGLLKSNFLIYIPSFLYLCGTSLIASYKFYILFCSVLSSFTMYLCIKKITKSNKIAIIASFLYSSCYSNIYINMTGGDIGITIFLPLIILGLYYLIYDNYNKWWIFLIGLTGLLECSLSASIVFFIIIFIFLVFNIKAIFKEKKRLKYLFLTLLLSLLLSLHFTMPYIEGLFQYNISFDLGVSLTRNNVLLSSILFIVISLFRIKIKVNKDDKLLKVCNISLCISYLTYIFAILFLLNILYLVASLFFVIADSIILHYLFKNKPTKEIIKYVIPIIMLGIIPYTIMTYNYLNTSEFIDTFEEYSLGDEDYLINSTNIFMLKSKGEYFATNNGTMLVTYSKKGNSVKINYEGNYDKGTYIEVPLLYFYGYVAIDDDGNNLTMTNENDDIIRVYLDDDKDSGSIHVYYRGTIIQRLSLYISLVTFLGLVIYCYRHNKERLNKKSIKKFLQDISFKMKGFKNITFKVKEFIKNTKQKFSEIKKLKIKDLLERRKEQKKISKEKEKSKNDKKLLHIEFFRVIAIVFVMFNHMSGFALFGTVTPYTFTYWFYMSLSILCKFAVPLFYMIAGAMLIKKQEELGTIYKKRVLKYFIILIVWSLIYVVYNYFSSGTQFSLPVFLKTIYYDSETGAFWYLYAYLAILMGLPLINKMAKNMQMKEFVYLAIMSFIFIGIIPIFEYRVFLGEHTINWNIRSTLFVSDPFTYPLMGYFFEYILPEKYYKWKNALIGLVLSIICIGVTCYITDFYCVTNGINYTQDFHNCLIAIPTYTIYFTGKLFFMKHKVSDKFKKVICYLGSLVFGVFLLENIVRPETEFIYKAVEPIIGALPANFVHIIVAYSLGLIIVAILKKIPIIKRLV